MSELPSIVGWTWLVVAFPLVGFLVNGALSFGRANTKRVVSTVVMALLVVRAVASAGMEHPWVVTFWSWMPVGRLHIDFALQVDQLSAVMMMVVTGVSAVIHVFSMGYMGEDAGYARYFSYLNLFVFFMLLLVLGANFPVMFVGWEGVGLCSYLLIGFWYEEKANADAGKKAFIMNRIGDFGFLIAMFLIFRATGSLDFRTVFASAPTTFAVGGGTITLITLALFLGCTGKSAQIPLYTWLPDAMAGPTPVSALIHAATMVAAGVYLVARSYFLFAASPVAMEVVGMIGGFTALMAATIAIAQSDIKRIIAYSTLSQLGLMMLAMGVGSMTAGMFHLTTHAFFKALLFLGAGSVIHALHTQEIWQMGGVRKLMRITAPTFLVGALANAGVFPFSGFWSKDDIIASAFESGHYGLFLIGLITTFFTGLYMFRLYFVVFHGEPSKKGHGAAHGAHAEEAHPHEEPHESPRVMTVPLIILAVFATVAGFVNVPGLTSGFSSYIYFRHPHPLEFRPELAFLSLSAALAGILVAWLYYGKRQYSADELVAKYPAIYHVLLNKYYFDELYFWVIRNVQDVAAIVCNWFEEWIIITTFVNGTSRMTRWAGGVLRLTQTGQLATYLLIFVAGVIVLVFLAFGGFVPYQMVAFR
jgi:NADH-quinone oxidoreductase subunit L